MNPTQQAYTNLAYQRMGVVEASWQPELGFRACEAILEKLYLYYQAIYLLAPRFYWAGLARLTGGQVLYGMRNLVKIARDPSVFTQEIMIAAKDIFDNLAWQHELFLATQTSKFKLQTVDLFIHSISTLDLQTSHTHPYKNCWHLILSGEPVNIALGNQMLLHNEQLNTIQRHYEIIKTDPYSARYFWFTRFVMRRIHPYHPRFIVQFPLGDVTCFPDRWKWITNTKGMWPAWVNLPEAERTRLVSLSNDQVVRHDW